MRRFLPDTDCMLAVVCHWHVHHGRATAAVGSQIANGETLVIAAPALIEAYSVLTRLPVAHRLSPDEARAVLETSFLHGNVEFVCLDAHAYRALFDGAPGRHITGGQVYDAVIYACALAANVDVLLTFNERHYRALAANAGSNIAIVVPT